MEGAFAYFRIIFQLMGLFWPLIVIPIVAVLLRRWIEKKAEEKAQDRLAKKIAEEMKKKE